VTDSLLGKGSAARAENRVARLEPGDIPAYHFHLAGHVMTEPTGFRGRGLAQPEQYSKDVRRAFHQAPVDRIDGGHVNFNQNFVVDPVL